MENEEILKKVRNVTLIVSAIYIALGVVILVFEAQVRVLYGYLLGALALGIGGYRMIHFFVRQKKAELLASDLYIGIALCSVGAVCIIRHDEAIVYSSFIFGILLIAGTIIKVQNAIDLQKIRYLKWWLILLLAVVSLVLSLILMLKPTILGKNYLLTSGIFLVYDGLSGLAAFVLFNICWREVRLAMKADPKILAVNSEGNSTESHLAEKETEKNEEKA